MQGAKCPHPLRDRERNGQSACKRPDQDHRRPAGLRGAEEHPGRLHDHEGVPQESLRRRVRRGAERLSRWLLAISC